MHSKPETEAVHRCPALEPVWQQLWHWYASPAGQRLAAAEQQLLQQRLANLFGYHLLQLGRLNGVDCLTASRVSHCVVMDLWREDPLPVEDQQRYRGTPHALPIQNDSIDVVVLPHVLEFAASPHEVLREVERVLIPEGHVLILSFNPWSLWSLWRWSLGWRAEAPWCGRFFAQSRIRDWLTLLGFEVGPAQGAFFRPPIRREAVLERLGWLDRLGRRVLPFLGAVNVLTAKKRVTTLTPIRPRWRPKRQAVVNGLKPTNRVARTAARSRDHGPHR